MTRFRAPILAVALLLLSTAAGSTVALLGPCADGAAPPVAPYLQDVTQTAASILWRSATEGAVTLRYGEDPNLIAQIESGPGPDHAVRLTGLRPDTPYAYAVDAPGGESDGTFRTAPGPDATVTAAVLGDSGVGGPNQRRMARVLLSLAPRFVLHTGDVVYPRGDACHYPDRFFDPYAPLLASTPLYPSLGNHDLRAAGASAYFAAFALPANNPDRSESYYSFDYGPAHVVALDGELYHSGNPTAAARQKAWLEADLAANRLPWTIVFFHRPPFTTSPAHAPDAAIRDDLVPLFAAAGVDLVLSGHVHAYERFHPIDGVTYVITGGGGARLYPVRPDASTAHAASVHHVLKLTISPARLTLEPVGRDGVVFDRLDLNEPR